MVAVVMSLGFKWFCICLPSSIAFLITCNRDRQVWRLLRNIDKSVVVELYLRDARFSLMQVVIHGVHLDLATFGMLAQAKRLGGLVFDRCEMHIADLAELKSLGEISIEFRNCELLVQPGSEFEIEIADVLSKINPTLVGVSCDIDKTMRWEVAARKTLELKKLSFCVNHLHFFRDNRGLVIWNNNTNERQDETKVTSHRID